MQSGAFFTEAVKCRSSYNENTFWGTLIHLLPSFHFFDLNAYMA